jgi:hypothetical protein
VCRAARPTLWLARSSPDLRQKSPRSGNRIFVLKNVESGTSLVTLYINIGTIIIMFANEWEHIFGSLCYAILYFVFHIIVNGYLYYPKLLGHFNRQQHMFFNELIILSPGFDLQFGLFSS